MSAVLATAIWIAPTVTTAQETSDAGPANGTKQSKKEQNKLGFGQGSFVAVPIPVNDPTFGAGLVLGGGYLFKADEGSNTSILGGGAFGTNKGSYAVALGSGLSLDHNRYNIMFLLGLADLNYDLFLLGEPLEIEQDGVAFQSEFRYSFTKSLSAGFSLQYGLVA
ncbi:hypothetical protein [Ruegeria hyattellae]|uniref:hypothetical protein n=1 Tax=Ruegeria hyattellae TaxID=3233337 RepID=UPI00355C9C89